MSTIDQQTRQYCIANVELLYSILRNEWHYNSAGQNNSVVCTVLYNWCPDKTSGDKTSGDKTSGDKTSGDKTSMDKMSVGTKRPWGQNVRSDKTYV